MRDKAVSRVNAQECYNEIHDLIEKHGTVAVTAKVPNAGSMPMLALWQSWMGSVARHMSAGGATMPLWIDANGNPYGKRPYDQKDAHAAFTALLMGTDDDGNRYSWSMSRKAGANPQAPKSKRLYAMDKMQVWMVERGIPHINPENSEYRKLQEQQERC